MSAPTRLRRLMPTVDQAIDMVAVVGFTLIALWSYESSYGGTRFMAYGAIAAVSAVLLVHVCAATKVPWPIALALGVVVYSVVASVLALGYQCLGGVVPTPRSCLNALTSAATSWKELLTTVPPVGTTGDLLVLPVFVAFVTAFAALAIARGVEFAAPALVPPLVAMGLGIAVGTPDPVSVVLHGGVLIVAMIGWLAWREQRRRPLLKGTGISRRRIVGGAAVLAAAGAIGFVLAPNAPGAPASAADREIWRQTVVPPFDPFDYPSPLAGYRDYVKLDRDADGEQVPATTMFTVEGLPAGVPIRLATMDAYDGLVWQVSGGDPDDPSLQDSGSFERVGASVPADHDGDEIEVTITIEGYNDIWVPDVGEVVSLRFTGSDGGAERDRQLASGFRYNRATDTAASPLALRAGDRYVMTVRLPESLDEMAGQQIVADVPRLGQARDVGEVTQAFSTPDFLLMQDTAERLDRIRDLMVETGAYSDGDERSGQIGSKAGHSQVRLVEFAGGFPSQPFIGNAEQYAAAYAVFFRGLHVPTRVVMGFVPEDASLDGPVEVLDTDVEAWVEVPVDGHGWVGIFPTPPRDQLSATATSPQQPEPDYRTQNPPPPPLVDPEFDRPAQASGDAKPLDEPDDDTSEDPGERAIVDSDAGDGPFSISGPVKVGGALALTPILIVLTIGLVAFVIKRIRRKRRRARGAPHERIANGWREVTDLATDMRRPVPPKTTRREAAGFVGGTTVGLAEQTDRAVWGGDSLTDAEVDQYWAELATALSAMKSEVGLVDRVRAAMSPRSIRRRPSDKEEGS